MDEGQIKFLEKFKRHIMASKEIYEEIILEYSTLTNSIYGYYDQLFKYIQPYENESKVLRKLRNNPSLSIMREIFFRGGLFRNNICIITNSKYI